MPTDTNAPSIRPPAASGVEALARLALTPVPLFLLQPVLGRIVRRIARLRPEIFGRIGPHTDKCFIIDPVNMPFVLVLHPDPDDPRLRAARRQNAPAPDARIAGSFLALLAVADGRLDGDALFFTRELVVEGDTEAAVCLRNALDDLEGSIADDVAEMFGPPGRAALGLLRRIGSQNEER
jgi:predicted lipid carrier protein YhbT